jgi:hypothetical protein
LCLRRDHSDPSRRPCHLATVLPSARKRGWEDRQRASARCQEGLGSSMRASTPAAGRVVAGSSPSAGLPSHRCPPAAVLVARRLSSQPRFARPGGRCLCLRRDNSDPPRRPYRLTTVLPSARKRGWEDRQRARARCQEGLGSSRRASTPAAGRVVAGSSPSAGLSSYPCPPAAVLGARRLSSQPRFARLGGRCLCLRRDNSDPPRRPCPLTTVLPAALCAAGRTVAGRFGSCAVGLYSNAWTGRFQDFRG